MTLTTGKLAKKIGIEPNTATVWLREEILIPAPKEGRNNWFYPEEAIVGSIVAAAYREWGLHSEILFHLAEWVRGYVECRYKLGFSSPDEILRKLALDEAAGMAALIADIENADEKRGAFFAMKHRLGGDDSLAQEVLNDPSKHSLDGDLRERLVAYRWFYKASIGEVGGYVAVSKNSDGGFYFTYDFTGDTESYSKKITSASVAKPETDSATFLVIDLGKVFEG